MEQRYDPETDSYVDDLERWRPADRPCPKCGGVLEIGDWWDDHPDNGGACIGYLENCTACDYSEQF